MLVAHALKTLFHCVAGLQGLISNLDCAIAHCGLLPQMTMLVLALLEERGLHPARTTRCRYAPATPTPLILLNCTSNVFPQLTFVWAGLWLIVVDW